MQKHMSRLLLSAALAAMLTLGTASAAFATPPNGSGEIDAGSPDLAETDGGSFTFPATHLSAIDTTSAMSLALTVNDLRGTGVGWALLMSMTQFTCSSGCSSKTLPATSTLNVIAECATNSTCTVPSGDSETCTVAPDTAVTDVTSPFTLCQAMDSGTGMGSVNVTPTLAIPIPSDSYIGTYSSTVTISVFDTSPS